MKPKQTTTDIKEKLVPDLLDKVVNLNETQKIQKRMIDDLQKKIDVTPENQRQNQIDLDTAESLSFELFKSCVKTNYPDKYAKYENMDKDTYFNQLLNNPAFTALSGDSNSTDTLINVYNDGEVVQISPNMFFKNVTTILNDVKVGNTSLDLSGVFNAFDFYNDGWLTSGISKLYTTEYAAAGIIMLDQNQVIPLNYNVNGKTVSAATQNIAGYQSSHPVFANLDYSDAGGGVGWGLFARANKAQNVWKLSVTNPKQYAEMNLLFIQLMENSKKMAIWLIATNNLFSNITNLVLDNTNTNMRDCFLNSLFPNIMRMSTPTQMFNIGDSVTYTNGTTTATYEYGTTTDTELDAATSAVRSGTLNSTYLIQGYNTNPQINSTKKQDIHIICTPTTYVNMFSGMLSVLYNYGFQSWDFYVPKENIHIIYKKPSISVSYLNPQQGLSAHLQPVLMNQEWFSDENMLIITKPKDVNNWPATYGFVWDNIQSQSFAAALVETSYAHFLIYGGVTPYAQGFWYHAKGLTQPLANTANPITQNITYDAGVPVIFKS